MGPAPALDAPALHVDRAGAVETLIRRDHAAVQCGGGGENLEGGARLVGVGDAAVAHQIGERLHVVPGRIVQVVVRLVDHGQNLAGLRIHHQHPHRLGVVHRQRLPRGLLREALDGRIQSQRHAAALHRCDVLAGGVVQLPALAVDLLQHPPGLAGQVAVQRLLQPRLTHAVDGGQAQHLAGELTHGIVSLALLLQIQARQHRLIGLPVLRHQRLELLGHVPGELTLEGHTALAGVRGLPLDGRSVHVQDRRKQLGKRRCVPHLPGTDRERIGRGALGQHRAVAVENPAPGGLDRAFAGPLGLGAQLQFLRFQYLQLEQPSAQQQEQYKEDRHQQRKAATDDRPGENHAHPSPPGKSSFRSFSSPEAPAAWVDVSASVTSTRTARIWLSSGCTMPISCARAAILSRL